MRSQVLPTASPLGNANRVPWVLTAALSGAITNTLSMSGEETGLGLAAERATLSTPRSFENVPSEGWIPT